eukprot:TRINITY_DN4446_c0_g1_i1.p3 TRINITY_DN4446_c0_g1~~TRINITY_DN4446_c0_g1_i1.p3  ORF type:complete len:190 (+),score=-15.07 TRINITY_DN4446_c0_g1_i1:135-704(+)
MAPQILLQLTKKVFTNIQSLIKKHTFTKNNTVSVFALQLPLRLKRKNQHLLSYFTKVTTEYFQNSDLFTLYKKLGPKIHIPMLLFQFQSAPTEISQNLQSSFELQLIFQPQLVATTKKYHNFQSLSEISVVVQNAQRLPTLFLHKRYNRTQMFSIINFSRCHQCDENAQQQIKFQDTTTENINSCQRTQ